MKTEATRLKMRRWSRRHRELNAIRKVCINTPKHGAAHGPLHTKRRCRACHEIHKASR